MKEQVVTTTGRPRRKDKPIKRTYYLPQELADLFVKRMGEETSRMVAAGMVMMLAVDGDTQKNCRDTALSLPPEQAIQAVREKLPEWLDAMLIQRHVRNLSASERSRILAAEHAKITRRH